MMLYSQRLNPELVVNGIMQLILSAAILTCTSCSSALLHYLGTEWSCFNSLFLFDFSFKNKTVLQSACLQMSQNPLC